MYKQIIVQKFGGTSLGTTELIKKAALKVSSAIKNGFSPIVVASAMAGTTNNLINLSNLMGIKAGDEEYDAVISAGEQISAGLFAAALRKMGIKSKVLFAWQVPIKTDEIFGSASILSIDDTYIKKIINGGVVPVISGFQGVTSSQMVTTLGRGGSDLTAVAIAKSVKAEKCDIFTDVDGVYNIDPRLIPSAKKIYHISYELMLEMASSGAKVLQEQSVAYAMKNNVLIRIASSFSDDDGTIVSDKFSTETSSDIIGITILTDAHDQQNCHISLIGSMSKGHLNVLNQIKHLLNLEKIDYKIKDVQKLKISISLKYRESQLALQTLSKIL